MDTVIVEWFDNLKGWGFGKVGRDGQSDILIHYANQMDRENFLRLQSGDTLHGDIVYVPERGRQLHNIVV